MADEGDKNGKQEKDTEKYSSNVKDPVSTVPNSDVLQENADDRKEIQKYDGRKDDQQGTLLEETPKHIKPVEKYSTIKDASVGKPNLKDESQEIKKYVNLSSGVESDQKNTKEKITKSEEKDTTQTTNGKDDYSKDIGGEGKKHPKRKITGSDKVEESDSNINTQVKKDFSKKGTSRVKSLKTLYDQPKSENKDHKKVIDKSKSAGEIPSAISIDQFESSTKDKQTKKHQHSEDLKTEQGMDYNKLEVVGHGVAKLGGRKTPRVSPKRESPNEDVKDDKDEPEPGHEVGDIIVSFGKGDNQGYFIAHAIDDSRGFVKSAKGSNAHDKVEGNPEIDSMKRTRPSRSDKSPGRGKSLAKKKRTRSVPEKSDVISPQKTKPAENKPSQLADDLAHNKVKIQATKTGKQTKIITMRPISEKHYIKTTLKFSEQVKITPATS